MVRFPSDLGGGCTASGLLLGGWELLPPPRKEAREGSVYRLHLGGSWTPRPLSGI